MKKVINYQYNYYIKSCKIRWQKWRNESLIIIESKCISLVVGASNKLYHFVNKIFKLKQKGINLIFPDVDKIEQLLIEELKSENE